MANTKPNSFTKGLVTDYDPGFQPKDSYSDANNVRVITNGSESMSLENIQDSKDLVVNNVYSTSLNNSKHGVNDTTVSNLFNLAWVVLRSFDSEADADNLTNPAKTVTAVIACAFDEDGFGSSEGLHFIDVRTICSLLNGSNQSTHTYTLEGMRLAHGTELLNDTYNLNDYEGLVASDAENDALGIKRWSRALITDPSNINELHNPNRLADNSLQFYVGTLENEADTDVLVIDSEDPERHSRMHVYADSSFNTPINLMLEDAAGSVYVGGSEYNHLGSVSTNDNVISVLRKNSDNIYKIQKTTIPTNSGLHPQITLLWEGVDLFDANATHIEMESVIETEDIHRIYCTDGITPLKSINIYEDDLANKTAAQLEAFQVTELPKPTLNTYISGSGELKYGAYAYTYRLAVTGQGNYTDWAPMSNLVNVIKGEISSNDSLHISGESSSEASNKSVGMIIEGLPSDYDEIEVAAIRYVDADASTVEIIENGFVNGTTYTFVHSGLESTTVLEGGIANVLISNDTWDVCKTLTQKDNKLLAGNLRSTVDDVDLSEYKVKSYKLNGASLETYEDEWNPDRHKDTVVSTDPTTDRGYYKFLEMPALGATTEYILGAETPGYTSADNPGYRVTFQLEEYNIDERFGDRIGTGLFEYEDNDSGITAKRNYSFGAVPYKVSTTDSEYLNGTKGSHNPKWDNEIRGYKRGETYRFGIVLYDKQGKPGFAHHIGDIRIPEANDANRYTVDSTGMAFIPNGHVNENWAPFGAVSTDKNVTAYALIPKIEVKLPDSVLDIISGYKIVRAEVSDSDKRIVTQGLMNTGVQYNNDQNDHGDMKNQFGCDSVPMHLRYSSTSGSSWTAYPNRVADGLITVDTPDVTLGGKSFNISGYKVRPVSAVVMAGENGIFNNLGGTFAGNYEEGNSSYWSNTNHPYLGGLFINDGRARSTYTDPDGDWKMGKYTWSMGYKYRPIHYNGTYDSGLNYDLKTVGNEDYLGWSRDIHFGKSVVNNELVPSVDTGLSKDFYNSARGDAHTATHHGEIGATAAGWNTQAGDFLIGKNAAVFCAFDGANAPSPAALKTGSGSDTYIGGRVNYWSSGGAPYSTSGETTLSQHTNGKFIVEIIKDTSGGFEQYGGENISALLNTRYIDTGIFGSVSDFAVPQGSSSIYKSTVNSVGGGDTFCSFYTYNNSYMTGDTQNTMSYATAVPLESSINIGLRSGSFYGSQLEKNSISEDQYLYNRVYSQELNLKGFVSRPLNYSDNKDFTVKVAASNTKLAGELRDAWATFPANDFFDLDLERGEITDMFNHNGQVYTVQESGIAALSINSRAIIQATGAAADIQIVSGTGTVIERKDYISNSGSQHFNKAVTTPSGVFVYDDRNYELSLVAGNQVVGLGSKNGYRSIFSDVSSVNAVKDLFAGYDPEFKEYYISLLNSSDEMTSLRVNALTGSLISKDDNSYYYYVDHKGHLYGYHETGEDFSLLNSGDNMKFNFESIINDEPSSRKVFDSTVINVDQLDKFDSIRLEDSLGTVQTITGSDKHYKIREGDHMVPLRALNSTERLRGRWLKMKVSKDDESNTENNKKFNIFALTSKIRKSR